MEYGAICCQFAVSIPPPNTPLLSPRFPYLPQVSYVSILFRNLGDEGEARGKQFLHDCMPPSVLTFMASNTGIMRTICNALQLIPMLKLQGGSGGSKYNKSIKYSVYKGYIVYGGIKYIENKDFPSLSPPLHIQL